MAIGMLEGVAKGQGVFGALSSPDFKGVRRANLYIFLPFEWLPFFKDSTHIQ